ncbi:protein CCSMST1 [Hippoglossus stenolepis]|uniref:protein CCSMST1 n=1 Tax=Hippoglossus stenolepis TaxID=195615 RepID=UPI00159C3010|nr:protein CCSMST1 [Hippoglossus stenolepis]
MSTAAGRVLSGVTRVFFSHSSGVRVNSVRSIALSSQRPAKSQMPTDEDEVKNEPIKFSTSKASHRTWKVDRSLGSQYERPWWKVLPISLVLTGFLLWCVLREETDIDVQLEKQLYEHLPGLLSDEEEEEEEVDKSS